MNALIKTVKAATNNKETLIKNSITTQLSNSVKEIQLCNMTDNLSGDSVDISEAGNTLCTIIEAMFLHGLKDSLVHKARRAIADVDERPEPSFWAPLLVISHRQIIEQITNFAQISTEIGQCRTWIRLALNDCLLSSYLSAIRQESGTIKPYYNSYAYLRDPELLDVAQRLIEGVETFTVFALPCNSSLLNTWPLQSLLLAGIWSPTLRSCPVVSGVDVAQSLQAAAAINPETSSISSLYSFTSHSSGIGQMLAFNEDEALKIILAKHTSEKNIQVPSKQVQVEEQIFSSSDQSDMESKSMESDVYCAAEPNFGNSLNRRSGWSFSESQENSNASDEPVSSSVVKAHVNVENVKSMEGSYNALIQSYNMLGGSYTKTPDLREVLQNFEGRNTESDTSVCDMQNVTSESGIDSLSNNHLINTESTSLSAQIGKIARERGLDYQNYECAACKEPLGLIIKPKVCSFTGEYFCDNCMSDKCILIPARIIHNWDFKTYPVSQKAFNYIDEIKDHATIDLKTLNPFIYVAIDDMVKLQSLRIQLNFLRDYLYTCREPVIEKLQKQMWPREYMYEHVHQYSVTDLNQITNGSLAQHLQEVVHFGREHVLNCWLCKQKGFICEICNKPKVLYPFDVDSVYRCNVCNAVYHNGCLNSSKPCPKCERKQKREDLPLFGATIE